MSLESFGDKKPSIASEDSTLNFEDAQHEATLLKAVLKEKGIERELTSEDYSHALEAVEELKKAVAEEGDAKMMAYQFGRILHNLVRVGSIPVIIFDTMLYTFVSNFDPDSRTGRRENALGPVTDEILRPLDKEISLALDDAGKKLMKLERFARKIEKDEEDARNDA